MPPKDALTRGMDSAFGWLFRGFNRLFHRGSEAYSAGVGRVISRKALMLVIYVALIAVTFGLFKAVPADFVPAQDKQYLIGFAQLPDGATLDRTDEVVRRMGDIMKQNPHVEDTIAFPGLSINGFTNSSNSGIVFATLKPFDERKRRPERRCRSRSAQPGFWQHSGRVHRDVPATTRGRSGDDRRLQAAAGRPRIVGL